jgi:hypothetical protein
MTTIGSRGGRVRVGEELTVGRSALVIGRKVSVVICALFIFRWIALLGCIIFLSADGGRESVVWFLHEMDTVAPTADWSPWEFVIKQIFYLFLTAGSGLAAIHFRRRIEAIDAVRDN